MGGLRHKPRHKRPEANSEREARLGIVRFGLTRRHGHPHPAQPDCKILASNGAFAPFAAGHEHEEIYPKKVNECNRDISPVDNPFPGVSTQVNISDYGSPYKRGCHDRGFWFRNSNKMDTTRSPSCPFVGPIGCWATVVGEEENWSRVSGCVLPFNSALLASASANMVRRSTGFALHRDGSMRDSGVARSTSAEPGKSAVLSLVACCVYTPCADSFLRT